MSNKNEELSQGYAVIVADNFHYMNEDESYLHGLYATYDEALGMARAITRRSLAEAGGNNPEEIVERYKQVGDDPYILPFGGAQAPEHRFSAWTYAESIAAEVSDAKNASEDSP
ncbi:MAG: hypothetical protein LAT55_12870 [Opitutales bacterium]|nr:hypothetical protein [Opitutales bacterium]